MRKYVTKNENVTMENQSDTDKNTVTFRNNKGDVIKVEKDATIADLVRMGIKDLRFIKKGTPVEDHWWVSTQ